jgi:ABC-type ATPase with predicted acetyltransferase domain
MYNSFDFEQDTNDNDNNETEAPKLEFLDYGEYRKLMNMDDDQKDKKEIPKYNNPLDIVKFESNKHKIKERQAMVDNIIPRLGSSTIINGKSGSGKTNLLLNLCLKKEFYGKIKESDKHGYFELVFLFSPTAEADDLAEHLGLEKKRIVTSDFENKLEHIFTAQERIIKSKGLDKSPKILLLYDDLQADQKFLKSKIFMRSFIANRHSNITTIFLSQSFTKTPRVCRLQASNIMIFPASESEIALLVTEYCPPHTSEKEFYELVKHATKDRFNFLHICMRVAPEERFRKNLSTILNIDR